MTKKIDLFNLIEKEQPDIICFGETRVSCPFFEVQNTLKEKIKEPIAKEIKADPNSPFAVLEKLL